MRGLWAFLAGSLFGIGLLISGMTDPRKVIGWLDIFGNWDPTLAFVLGGAVGVMSIAWAMARKSTTPVLGGTFPAPSDPRLERRLAIGSVLFGMGWGLSGLCPGPAMASITWTGTGGAVFLVAMGVGMFAAPNFGKSRMPAPS
ncbi:MAG: DUF6691 family protein [Paracoccaceae bacterium]